MKACKTLSAPERPAACPEAVLDSQPCKVCKWGTIKSRILVNSAGCFTLMAERYYCSTHERSWLLPAGNDSRGLSLGGDILGNFLIQGDYWPSALQLFQDTENFSCLERSLRDRTASTLSSAIQKHPLRAVLSDLELTVVRRAALVHCRQCPSAPTQKSWLCHWVANMVAPHAAWPPWTNSNSSLERTIALMDLFLVFPR